MRRLQGILGAAVFGAALAAGCSIPVQITRPTPSGPSFSDPGAARATLKVVDARVGPETTFHVNPLNFKLSGIEAPVAYLAESLGAEFAARGYPVTVVTDPTAPADAELRVTRFRIISRRGYFTEVAHQFRGVLTSGSREQPILAYFFDSKASMGESSRRELFTQQESILVREIASKVNRAAFGFRSGDEVVARLLERAKPKERQDDGPFWEILELAGTNNPAAMEPLRKYVASPDEFVRMVALDAIGILGPQGQREFLESRFAVLDSKDKFMALKAIGDAGDEDSLQFVRKQAGSPLYEGEAGFQHLVDLYTGK